MTHDFTDCLARSHAASDLPIWATIYTRAFPTMVAMVDHRADGEHQRAGIDRSIILANSKQILVDEKVREKDYGDDVFLERWSNYERRVDGWVKAAIRADYIAYAILPRTVCFLLPVIQLQQAWARHEEEWIATYRLRDVSNKGWTTKGCAVPTKVLFPAIGRCLRINYGETVAA